MNATIGKMTVETWKDPKTGDYVTQIKDENGNQVGDADYAGDRIGARYNHDIAINAAKELVGEMEGQTT